MIKNRYVPFYEQEELEKCSKCGFCQAFCPVYKVTGREPEGARGRNVQLLGVLRGELSISEIEPALSTCLLCRACVPSCYTGVKTDELVRAGREAFVKEKGEDALKKALFRHILSDSNRLSFLSKFIPYLQRFGLTRLVSRINLFPEHLRIAAGLLDSIKNVDSGFKIRNSKLKIAYFKSCGFTYLLPEIGNSTVKFLESMGYEIAITDNNCCGLPPYAHGYTDEAGKLARKNIEALEGAETIITECGSCSSFLKEYADLLSDDPGYAERAKRLSERVVDSNEFLFKSLKPGTVPILRLHCATSVNRDSPLRLTSQVPSPKPLALKVTYHDPCHLSRYQNITREPREIIKSIPGVEFIELPEADWCCGGAGSYSITNNDLSMKVLERKMDNVRKTGADILATSCPACMIQLSYGVKRSGLNVKVLHVNQMIELSLKTQEVPAME